MANLIKAPFNFVPLNNKVFIPNWSEEISHDIPFEDGQSGEISLEMEALTPIYVRNGVESAKQDKKNSEYTSFSKIDERYFLPATSIKGMIRNVLEIMSFSKMPVDSRKRYAQRDWENTSLYTLKNIKVQNTIQCGWLVKQNDTYKIEDCGRPYRINHLRIDEYLKSNGIPPFLEKNFCETSPLDLNKELLIGQDKFDPKSARYKYELLNKNSKVLENVRFEEDQEYCNDHQSRRMIISPSGDKTGTIVFTGQPNIWMKDRHIDKDKAGKFYEFIFPQSNGKSFKVTEKEVDQFKFIYQDSEDWRYWKKKFENGTGIPIFFRTEGKTVKDFGFALLYKLPYQNSVEDLVNIIQKEKGTDLAECIFGYTSKMKSLKGRVQFGNAFAFDGINELEETKTVLGSPKASYYPLYIEQEGKNGKVVDYKTYNDGNIRGWKRYPVKAGATPKPTNVDNMDTVFKPLDKGVRFKTIIRFHNLKRVELGALLSAITFHGNENNVCHNIGMAKPLGYGKLKISCHLNGALAGIERELMGEYEQTMNKAIGNGIPNSWINSEQINELLTMGYDKHGAQEDLLQYMKLEIKGPNEFILAKTQKEYLKKFSEISTSKFKAVSIFEEVKSVLLAEENRIKEELATKEKTEREKAQKKKEEEEAALKLSEEEAKRAKIQKMSEDGPQFLNGESDFKRGSGKIDSYLKKVGSIPTAFLPVVKDFLISCYTNPKNRETKKWKSFEDSPIWKKIKGWVGNDTAQEWYNSIINK